MKSEKHITVIKFIAVSVLLLCSIRYSCAQNLSPDTVIVNSGKLKLKGLLWGPTGKGTFPAIIFCHGSYETDDIRYDVLQQTSVLGQLFAKNGYIFFCLFRRGVGLSKGQGENSSDIMAKAFNEKGEDARNKVQIKQLQTDDLMDMISGLRFLRQRRGVDTNHIAIIGHSFGASLALLVAERDPRLKAVVVFGAAGYSWNRSPQLRQALFTAVENIDVPVMFIHAQNDYSVSPGRSLDSVLNRLNKQHLLKIYPPFGSSLTEGHNFIFLSPGTWEADVFRFLRNDL